MYMRVSIAVDPRKGLRFLHSRVIDYDKKPALYQVTKIVHATVYYRPVYDAGIVGSERMGKCESCRLEDFDRICLAPRDLVRV
jgi:hypothetical protein